MNEIKWLGGTDGEEMLDFVADRLCPRQWLQLSAAYLRRLWDILPEGVLRNAVEMVERAESLLPQSIRDQWLAKINVVTPDAVRLASRLQRDIVHSADPDSADLEHPLLERPNQVAPAFPLFRAASTHARTSIERIETATHEAAEAVRRLFAEPSEEMLSLVRQAVEQAAETKIRAAQAANDALKLKHEGDELADRAAAVKNKRLEESKALEFVRKIEEGRQQDAGWQADERRAKAASKHLARLLREIIANPFREPRFEEEWRTGPAIALAATIFEERAFDRMPILADALLDADCDDEQILRHLRGTEVHSKEPLQHTRGCWVLEMVLGHFQPLPPAPKNKAPRRRLKDDYDIGLMGENDEFFA